MCFKFPTVLAGNLVLLDVFQTSDQEHCNIPESFHNFAF